MFPARPKGTRMTTPLDTETEPEELPPTNQEPLRQLNGVQERISASVLRLAMRFESKPLFAVALLSAIYFVASLGHSLARPLWHDELFTFYIAQAPSASTLLHDTRLVDLNPPLSYLLTRASFAAFGANTLSCRLPEILGYLLAMLCLFKFVERRLGVLYGVLAAALLFTGTAGDVATEARPYGLLLGFSALSILAWQKAHDRNRYAIPLLLLGGFGMLLSHVFGVFLWSALTTAELLDCWQRRKVDWPHALAWIAPLISVFFYWPLLHAHGASIYPPDFQPDASVILSFYVSRTELECLYVLTTALALFALAGSAALRPARTWLLTRPEWTSTILVIAAPLPLIAMLMHQHAAFFTRYGTMASLGVSIAASAFLARWTNRSVQAALICIAIALFLSGELGFTERSLLSGKIWHSTEPRLEPCAACAEATKLNPTLPLVDASGLTFIEMDHREDATLIHRVFYLTDPTASATYAHANLFESMALEKEVFPIRANVDTYADFKAQHRHFFVLGNYNYPEDWLLRKLQADGATLKMLGHFNGPYKDHDLYDVTF
jgi:hypothetical protein